MNQAELSTRLEPGLAPPPSYYRDNCTAALEFVFQHYNDMLPQSILVQLAAYTECSLDAQRLFARLLTRKGPFYRLDSLDYEELDDKSGAIEELLQKRLVDRRVGPADRLLGLTTKKEMLAWWPQLDRRERKDLQIAALLSHYTDRQIAFKVREFCPYIKVSEEKIWKQIQLLYFGNEMQGWSEFVIRDLGLSKFESPAGLSKQFENNDQLSRHFTLTDLVSYSYRLDEFPNCVDMLIARLRASTDNLVSERKRIKALNRIGKWCEKNNAFTSGLQAYSLVRQHPARERMARICHKAGNIEQRDSLLRAIRHKPYCEEEQQFVQRFGKRNAGYAPATSTITISKIEGSIEQTILDKLTEKRGWGLHCENSLLRSLTGLAYWKVIYAPVQGAFTNPFQVWPHDLNEPDFSAVRSKQIETLEQKIVDDEKLKHHLVSVCNDKKGTLTNMVSWGLFRDISVEDYVEAIGPKILRRLMAYLIRHLHSRRKGFPDLFVSYGDGVSEFVEIKGPGDQLSLSQRVWLQQLESMDISARVIRVKVLGKT